MTLQMKLEASRTALDSDPELPPTRLSQPQS